MKTIHNPSLKKKPQKFPKNKKKSKSKQYLTTNVFTYIICFFGTVVPICHPDHQLFLGFRLIKKKKKMHRTTNGEENADFNLCFNWVTDQSVQFRSLKPQIKTLQSEWVSESFSPGNAQKGDDLPRFSLSFRLQTMKLLAVGGFALLLTDRNLSHIQIEIQKKRRREKGWCSPHTHAHRYPPSVHRFLHI